MKIIAIDGPSGSGKGTIAKEVAKRLGFTYIDTGAMYRCVALKSIRENIEETKEDEIVDLLKNMDIRLTNDGKVYMDDEDVSDMIREMNVTSKVSKISSIIKLREQMRLKQRDYANKDNIVITGNTAIDAMATTIKDDYYHEIFDYKAFTDIKCGITGFYQPENAALAIETATSLGVDAKYIKSGIERASNPARFEIIDKDIPVIF